MTELPELVRLQQLLARLEARLGELEATDDSERAFESLGEMAEIAREVQAEIDLVRREGRDALA